MIFCGVKFTTQNPIRVKLLTNSMSAYTKQNLPEAEILQHQFQGGGMGGNRVSNQYCAYCQRKRKDILTKYIQISPLPPLYGPVILLELFSFYMYFLLSLAGYVTSWYKVVLHYQQFFLYLIFHKVRTFPQPASPPPSYLLCKLSLSIGSISVSPSHLRMYTH